MIPFHSNSRQHRLLDQQLSAAISSIDLTDDKAPARELEKFEHALADYCGVGSAIAVASGTDALTIALRALDLPAGAEVITCDFGFYATALSILTAGLTPVFVDVSDGQMVVSADAVRQAISPRTAAIVPVHLFGEAADMAAIQDIAASNSLVVVEDAAQAVGARFDDHMVGGFGAAAGLSFNWSKHLSSTSNGGAVLTSDPNTAERLRNLRHYGDVGRFTHTHLGINSKLNPFEAAILSVKLPYLDGWIERRRQVADRYKNNLRGCPQVVTPNADDASSHVYHKYTIRVPHRDQLKQHLSDQGVGTLVCYPRLLHDQPALAGQRIRVEDVKNAAQLTDEVLSLPSYPELTDEEIDFICEAIVSFFDKDH